MLSTVIWYRLQELNPYSQGRNLLYYPLYESGMVRETGLEPVCPCERQILSLLCIPFHHSRILVPRAGLEPATPSASN